MLDEIAGEAILKIPLSSGSCALGSDDRFYLNWIGREKMTENHRLHQADISGRGHDEFRLVRDISQLLMAGVLERAQTQKQKRAYRHENRADRPEHEEDLFAHRQFFELIHCAGVKSLS